jgi:single-strand DNA-binding protein
MNLKNHVQLIGNLGAIPVVKETANGQKMARFSIATTESYKEDGKNVEKTYWHNIIAWGKMAETIEQKCEKGTEVVLNGKLVSRSYDDPSGAKKYITEVVVSEIICRPKAVA